MSGLYRKYIITKADGSPTDPKADYFVLRLDTDPRARHAARTYARDVESKNPELAADIRHRCDEYSIELVPEPVPEPVPPCRDHGETWCDCDK